MTLGVTTEISNLEDTTVNSEKIKMITRDYRSGMAVGAAINKLQKNMEIN